MEGHVVGPDPALVAHVEKQTDDLLRFLKEHDSDVFYGQYRDPRQRRLANKGSFCLGKNTVSFYNKQYIGKHHAFIKHPYKDTAVNTRHPRYKKNGRGQPKKSLERQLVAYDKACKIFESIDHDWSSTGISVQITKHEGRGSKVLSHKDLTDCSHQYSVAFGEFAGARLVCTTGDGDVVRMPDTSAVIKFDGRLEHRVDFDGFEGTRYTAIVFKSYDPRMTQDDAVLAEPVVVMQLGQVAVNPLDEEEYICPLSDDEGER